MDAAGRTVRQPGIPRRVPDPASPDFDALRAEGLALVQALSGELWTDYNLHDPGVTLLETLCYALTEGVYGAEHSVNALLGGPGGNIDLARHALHPGPDSLPTRPVTGLDYQRWILDQVPELERLGFEPLTASDADPPGLWKMSPQISSRGGRAPADAVERAARAYLYRRNLGEDLAAWPEPVQAKECALRLELSVQGSRDVVEILAELVSRCAELVACGATRVNFLEHLGEGLGLGLSLADLLEGPPNQRGWIESGGIAGGDGSRLFFSDLARALKAVEGVEEIRSLDLHAPELTEGGGSLPCRGPGWALQLRWPGSVADLSSIAVFRAGAPVSFSAAALLGRLAELAATSGAARAVPEAGSVGSASPLALPGGEGLPEFPYFPAQNHLPPTYRGADALRAWVGDAPANPAESAAFRGYLALFEQWMAHAEAQRGHLRDLFTVDADPARSYWWRMLGDGELPGIDALYLERPARVQSEVFEALDDVLERRGRVLDFLLSLHGVGCEQDRLRAFGCYFLPLDWERHLFEQKRLLLQHVVDFTRDRMGGFDYTRPCLDVEDNTPVVQRRVALDLGFKHRHAHLLTRAFEDLGLGIARDDDDDAAGSRLKEPTAPPADWLRVAFPDSAGALKSGPPLEALRHLEPLRRAKLHPAFWRCAAHAERYWLAPADSGMRLFLGPDEAGHWWRLSETRHDHGSARHSLVELARGLRELSAGVHLESEGLHLVEHLLLRPLRPPVRARDDVPSAFYSHRLTAVFPAWTTRGADPAFRRFAEDTLAYHLPAHLSAHCLWLEFHALKEFEGHFQEWLEAKRLQSVSPEDGDAAAALDLFSGVLRRWLWARLEGASPDGFVDVEP